MATLQQTLTRIDAICPNAWDETAKLLWLNECESMIQTRILGAAPEACITYDTNTDRSTTLLVPAPFDRLYVYYVIAMCDYAAHETAHYADSMMLFNAALDEYAKWYQRANGSTPIAPGQLQQIAANTKARHTHENLAVLNGITAGTTAVWDAKADRTTATTATPGLMSAADKQKLDGISTGATKVTVDSAMSDTSVNPVQNKTVKAALDAKAGKTVATQSANGLMSAADKSKLDGIAAGANKTVVDTAMSDTSTNPVQNKIVKQYVDGRAAGSGAVRYDAAQELTVAQQRQALENIDAVRKSYPELNSPVMIKKSGETGSRGIYLSTVATSDKAEIKLEDANENCEVAIANLRTPTGTGKDSYAATKGYVDSKVAEIGSGAALPSVTAADNGKILRVVSGAWAIASLPVYSGGVS